MRSTWPWTIVVTISSSTPVRSTSASSCARTDDGPPTTCDDVHDLTMSRSERREVVLGRLLGCRVHVRAPRPEPQERERARRRQPASVLVGLAAHHRDAEHHMRMLQLLGRPELRPVRVERIHRARRAQSGTRTRTASRARPRRARCRCSSRGARCRGGSRGPEPRSRAGTDGRPGTCPRRSARSCPSCSGKSSAVGVPFRRSACAVTGSVPGARPIPRSMRPGWSASSIPNCSTTVSGAWFGSMSPPEPSRIVDVAAARCASSTAGDELAMPGMLWCSATQCRR